MDKLQVFSIKTTSDFNKIALEIFAHQAKNCIVYKEFIGGLNIDAQAVKTIEEIPFLPIEFFK
jgi:hypothetical protein